MSQTIPSTLIQQMRRCLSEAPDDVRPLWTAAAAVFLSREEPRWNVLAENALLMERRFCQFLDCPSSYDLIAEMLNEEGEGAAPAGGAPANNSGGGAIAGLGVPAAPGMSTNPRFAEPPVDLRKKKKRPEILTRASMTQTESVEPSDTFAGADVFEADLDAVHNARFGKNRYHRWSKYVGEDEFGVSVRDHAKSTKRDIVIKDQTTGVMTYLRKRTGR